MGGQRREDGRPVGPYPGSARVRYTTAAPPEEARPGPLHRKLLQAAIGWIGYL